MLEPGAAAPPVHLKTLQGEQWDLHAALGSGPVLLVFFKISCPTCQFTLPFLNRLTDSSVASIVSVSQDDATSTRQFQEHFGVHLPTVLDEPRAYAASAAFQLTHVPSMFLVEPDGIISWSVNGFHRAELENLAARLKVTLFRPEERVPVLRPG